MWIVLIAAAASAIAWRASLKAAHLLPVKEEDRFTADMDWQD